MRGSNVHNEGFLLVAVIHGTSVVRQTAHRVLYHWPRKSVNLSSANFASGLTTNFSVVDDVDSQ